MRALLLKTITGVIDGLACETVAKKWEPFFADMEACFDAVDAEGASKPRPSKERDALMAKVELPLMLTRSYFGKYGFQDKIREARIKKQR